MAQRIDINAEFDLGRDIYLLEGVTPQGRGWLADNISARTPRIAGKIVCESHHMPHLAEAVDDDGLFIC